MIQGNTRGKIKNLFIWYWILVMMQTMKNTFTLFQIFLWTLSALAEFVGEESGEAERVGRRIENLRQLSFLSASKVIHSSISPFLVHPSRGEFLWYGCINTNVLWVIQWQRITIWTGIRRKGWKGESWKACSKPFIIVDRDFAVDKIIKGKFWLLQTRFRRERYCLSLAGLLDTWWKEEEAAGKGGVEEKAGRSLVDDNPLWTKL